MPATKLVRDYMSRNLVTLQPHMELLQAVNLLVERNISGAPVVDPDGRLLGLLTERDCMKVVLNATYHSEYGGVVSEFMTTRVVTLAPGDNLMDAALIFLRERYHRYPVLDNGLLVGILSRRDVLRALQDVWQ